jgi:hypothetical protein
MDMLGVNAYRGPSFTTLWSDVEKKLGLPVLFFEFGSDAFNALRFEEDQRSQALLLKRSVAGDVQQGPRQRRGRQLDRRLRLRMAR